MLVLLEELVDFLCEVYTCIIYMYILHTKNLPVIAILNT